MKIATVAVGAVLIPVIAAIPMVALAWPSHDFDAVVDAVEHRYSAHAERVPMMGLVSLCAHVATHGGVKGLKVAEFDHLPNAPDTAELAKIVRDSLGPEWQPFVRDVSKNGDMSVIYVQPDGASMRMMIADFEHGELDLVRLEVNGDHLEHWVNDPEGSAKRHDYGTGGQVSPD